MKRRRPSTSPAMLVIIAAVATTALLSACGGKVIDHMKAEEFIRQDLTEAGVKVGSVSCPKGVEVKGGTDFECEVSAGGEKAVVQMRIVDDEGRVKPIEIRSAEDGSGADEKE